MGAFESPRWGKIMQDESTSPFDVLARTRVVFVHSAGRRMFLGRASDGNAREVTLDEVETLASAGFDIVEVNKSDGEPLCAALALLLARGATHPSTSRLCRLQAATVPRPGRTTNVARR
jgi:hypothetical protein